MRVESWLAQRNFELLDRNFRIAGGEIDLIARVEEAGVPTIVFVEVRSRQQGQVGTPEATISRLKQRKIIRTATQWLVTHDLWERCAVRFDVVAVDLLLDEDMPNGVAISSIRHIPNAFEARV